MGVIEDGERLRREQEAAKLAGEQSYAEYQAKLRASRQTMRDSGAGDLMRLAHAALKAQKYHPAWGDLSVGNFEVKEEPLLSGGNRFLGEVVCMVRHGDRNPYAETSTSVSAIADPAGTIIISGAEKVILVESYWSSSPQELIETINNAFEHPARVQASDSRGENRGDGSASRVPLGER